MNKAQQLLSTLNEAGIPRVIGSPTYVSFKGDISYNGKSANEIVAGPFSHSQDATSFAKSISSTTKGTTTKLYEGLREVPDNVILCEGQVEVEDFYDLTVQNKKLTVVDN